MPIFHEADSENDLSVTRITGTITVCEAVDYIKDRIASPGRDHRPVLVDAWEAY